MQSIVCVNENKLASHYLNAILRMMQEENPAKGKKTYVFCGPRESF